jgi:beta-lactamase regulating signal transducer with metallopeptidase domain
MTPGEFLFLMGEASARSVVLGLAVCAVIAACRIKNVRIQLLLWTAVLAASLSMPLLMSITPDVRLPVTAMPITGWKATPEQQNAGTVSTTPAAVTGSARASSVVSVNWIAVAATAWTVGSAAFVIQLLAGLRSCRRLKREGRSVPPADLPPEFHAAAARAGLRRLPELIESARVSVPLTFGVRHPVLLLPAGWRAWDGSRRVAVFSHELSHVARHDFLLQLAAKLHTAAFPFNPFGWWLERKLASLGEQASDEDGVRAVGNAAAYAEVVLAFLDVRRSAGGRLQVEGGVAMARISNSVARVERILSPAMMLAGPVSAARKAGALGGIVTLSLLAAACGSTERQSTPMRLVNAAFAQAAEAVNGRDGSYAYVRGDGMMMDGTSADSRRAASYRGRYGNRYLWFRRAGTEYIVTNEALLDELDNAAKPQAELGRQQAELGREQALLGEQQAKLGESQASAAVDMPDLTRDVERLSQLVQRLRARKASQTEVGELQNEIGLLQARIGELQDRLGKVNAALGHEQEKLGTAQAKLGERQSVLGRRQEELAQDLQMKVREIIERSLRTGAARRVA